ncbi:leucine-rich repeat-containing protein 43 isoform X2 [Rhinolophus ferrumequinum]|uniref:leucine-rich repeat-containing protein 43 isoform X2 n=1 Tax=Rhinolophus ferrumequinum TaxID=59479 RepID=UPI00140F9884|nr:leucine-rich repeat-containing protein 43 isoform X2 [Rhinolophus ferrumequinum]
MEARGRTVSAAVQEHLRRLCLHEFPCGIGSWNKSRFLSQTWRSWRELIPREEVTGSPGEETVEDLLGLVCSPHSPWALLEGSSAEDRFLRQLAIQNPRMLKVTFFYSYFRSLQVVDKQVSLVDKDLLKFSKLEELVLSANQIKEIDAVNLPPTLKVLELYGNSIPSMECLCVRPPPGLQHLGLGHNKLLGPSQSLYITARHWPNLVSLDLGFNDLTDLQSMMGSLSSLRHLRLLVLQGNPLALVPYYRGFTIDSLAGLCVLDDITVSPSEKHQFRGLSRSGDFLAHEAQFVVTIGSVTGVLDTSVLDPEPGPQGPFITYSYYVTYNFVEDEEGEGGEYVEGVLAEIVKPSPSVKQLGDEIPEKVIPEEVIPQEVIPEKVIPQRAKDPVESVPSTTSQSADMEESVASGGSTPLPTSAEELAKLRPRIDPQLCRSPGTVLFSTVRKPWADIIQCNYEMQHTLRDLVPLKAFLLAGTTVTVVEEKILSWPVVPPLVDSPLSTKKGKGEKDKKEEKGKKGKDGNNKAAAKGEKETAKEWKGSKKKRELSKELRQDPPILRVLGSGRVLLEPLLMGEPLVSTVCNFGVIRTMESDRLTFFRDSKNKKAKKAGETRKNKTKFSAVSASGEAVPILRTKPCVFPAALRQEWLTVGQCHGQETHSGCTKATTSQSP